MIEPRTPQGIESAKVLRFPTAHLFLETHTALQRTPETVRSSPAQMALTKKLKEIRLAAGDESLLAVLREMDKSDRAIEYIFKVPLHPGNKRASAVVRTTRPKLFGIL